MKVFIITMDDPVQTIPFLRRVIEARPDWMAGVAVTQGDRLTLKKGKSKLSYLLALLLIMGPQYYLRNVFITMAYKIAKRLSSRVVFLKKFSFEYLVKKMGLEFMKISSPNSPEFLNYLKSLDIDVIINQSQSILKKDLLGIPRIGVLNRHNALLPRNRGRLTPFWVLYRNEAETGVSIHFVTEKLDAGEIVIQKKIQVDKNDTFRSLVEKNYQLAPLAMIEALEKLEEKDFSYLPNNDSDSTYNSTPSLREAWEFRKRRSFGFLKTSRL
jgi:methionyl-tRNA formyltransferase